MKILEVEVDVDSFQWAVPSDGNLADKRDFDGTLISAEEWGVPAFKILNPRKKRGGFFHIAIGAIGIWGDTYEKIGSALEIAGQLLPVSVNGEAAYCLNITECVDCLDESNSEWILYSNGKRSPRIKRYSFLHHMMTASSLFKIPNGGGYSIFAKTNAGLDEEDDFFYLVNKYRILGLKFNCVYEG